MSKGRHQIFKVLLGSWALVPCTLSLAVTTVVMVMAMMQADDFDREMTAAEVFMAFTPLIPLGWLALIIASMIVELRSGNINTKTGLVIAVLILVGYVSWLVT